ncbi:MAG: serine/threonine protein kinase [Gammaproteobacteria bacterium]|jgi:tRNA A-37 threonylcarbamoyl transferase component Bud32|nr:serine/threonine protein kinase [Gammaproteobacteria bacterium]
MEIPGYKIQREIGKGGMATVYLAIQESLGRPVVLKVMGTNLDTTPEFSKRFLNEGHVLASLTHPNIITIFDIGIAEDFLYISMEYLGGGSLAPRIAQGMNPEGALDIVRQIGAALAFAHAKGIVHRDVKPANILYRDDGAPVLTDFGIAKQEGDSELTSTGTILGSPYYMSPEQAEGRVALDGRSDIYSLGIIFYEMLTGRRPYEGDSAITIVLQHLQAPVPRLPRGLERYQPLLDRMLAKKRDQRLRDAATLVSQVKTLQVSFEGTRVLQRPGVGPVSAQAAQAYRDGHITQRLAAPANDSRLRVWIVLGGVLLLLIGATGGYFAHQINQYTTVSIAPAHGAPPRAGAPPSAAPGLSAAGVRAEAAEADPMHRQVVTALKWLGRKSLEESRLTSPPEDNAYYYFARLLELDPGNSQAAEGIADIARRYAQMAETQIRRGNYALAETYLTEGLRVDPSNKQLQVLRSGVQIRERSLLDGLLGLLRGES